MNNKDQNEKVPSDLKVKKLYLRYMLCLRCELIVKSELQKLDLPYKLSTYSALEFRNDISDEQYISLKKTLKKSGIVLLSESESLLIDKIINTVIEIVHYSDILPKVKFMDLVREYSELGEEAILKMFSDVMGMTIVQFIVIQKIERAKELLLYDNFSITEMADILNYKNKYYFLAQFKKVTGLAPSYFKKIKKERARVAKLASDTVVKSN